MSCIRKILGGEGINRWEYRNWGPNKEGLAVTSAPGGGTWMKGRPGERGGGGSAVSWVEAGALGGVGEEVSEVTDNFQAGQLEDAAATA